MKNCLDTDSLNDDQLRKRFEQACDAGSLSTVRGQLWRIARKRWPELDILWDEESVAHYLHGSVVQGIAPLFYIGHVELIAVNWLLARQQFPEETERSWRASMNQLVQYDLEVNATIELQLAVASWSLRLALQCHPVPKWLLNVSGDALAVRISEWYKEALGRTVCLSEWEWPLFCGAGATGNILSEPRAGERDYPSLAVYSLRDAERFATDLLAPSNIDIDMRSVQQGGGYVLIHSNDPGASPTRELARCLLDEGSVTKSWPSILRVQGPKSAPKSFWRRILTQAGYATGKTYPEIASEWRDKGLGSVSRLGTADPDESDRRQVIRLLKGMRFPGRSRGRPRNKG